MARKKKTSKKSGGGLFSFFSRKKKSTRSKKQKRTVSPGLRITAWMVAVTSLVAAAAVGFIYMDRYVKSNRPAEKRVGSLVLNEPGPWVNEEWQRHVEALVGLGPFPLDETSAQAIARKLTTLSWMDRVRVQTFPDRIEVYAEYLRPVGLVDLGRSKYYLAADMTVLDYIPVTAVPVIEITGIASPRSIPAPGSRWAAADAAAAVELLDWLYKMDLHFQNRNELEKPLLDEMKSIDVSNFAGRKNNDDPHLTLTVKDGTKILWGAAWGQATRNEEQNEQEKLTDLYQFFIDHNNTLQGTAKYIELRQI